jgi:hypothetical protein
MHEKIQSNPFVGKDAREFAVDVEYAGSSGTSGSVVDQNFNVSDFGENACGNTDTTQDAVGLGFDIARSEGIWIQASGGQITGADVFAQSELQQVSPIAWIGMHPACHSVIT